jgi:hypothetical protein
LEPEYNKDTSFIWDEQRLRLSSEFNHAILHRNGYSPIYTGPQGVGKSSIALSCYLLAFAQSRPTVYIPLATDWVNASTSKITIHHFFMKHFFIQNADLIVKSDAMIPFFRDQLERNSISNKAYSYFTDAIKRKMIGPCNFIIDEGQKLVKAVERSNYAESLRFFTEVNTHIKS